MLAASVKSFSTRSVVLIVACAEVNVIHFSAMSLIDIFLHRFALKCFQISAKNVLQNFSDRSRFYSRLLQSGDFGILRF